MKALVVFLCLAQVAWAAGPRETTQEFYNWYFERPTVHGRSLAPAQKWLEPAVYAQLQRLLLLKPAKDGAYLDSDPFLGGQVGAESFSLGPLTMSKGRAHQTVHFVNKRMGNYKTVAVLKQHGDRWLIGDWYDPEDKPRTMRTTYWDRIEKYVREHRRP